MAVINLSAIAAGTGGFVIDGAFEYDYSGRSVSSAGDVNGDGLADLIVGAPAGEYSYNNAGRSYVVFGRTGTAAIDLANLGADGFVINGDNDYDESGTSVAGAGDVNGDGLADLIVGAPRYGEYNSGRSYVVFGKAGTGAVNLSALGPGGFVINGEYGLSGSSVSGAGDVNGDGLADLIVGAPSLYIDDIGDDAGRSYVVFGKTSTGAVNLESVVNGIGGFAITGQDEVDVSGFSVAGAGDVNGDGLADLIVGAPSDEDSPTDKEGRSYVVFGKSGGASVDLGALGTGGFVINGQDEYDYAGRSVAGAGDVNGDGLADLIVGAPSGEGTPTDYSGRSYVVFGKTGTGQVNLAALGNGGFVINGQEEYDYSGKSVAGAGDVNGDGLADLIVGVREAGNAGRSYVVFGKAGTAPVELTAVANNIGGFVINGEVGNDRSGVSAAAAGDVNGDGLADLIVGAYRSDPLGRDVAGRSYVIFGSTTGAFGPTLIDELGDSGPNTLTGTTTTNTAETLVGGAGEDTFIADGGADVLYGGAGNDTFALTTSNVTALGADLGAGSQLARIDGGSGLDTIRLEGAGITLNLAAIDNQGGATPGSASRLESIERIDLTGSGVNTLVLTARDAGDLADMNLINSTTRVGLGWANDTYTFANTEVRHQLIVDGNAGDIATLQGSWLNMGTVTHDGHTHTVYNSVTGRAQVLVANAVTHDVQAETGNEAGINLVRVADGTGGFVINGESEDDTLGASVGSAGDINGDGLTDLIVGSPRLFSHYSEDDYAGRSYVVFGRTGNTPIDLGALGSSGFVINGQFDDDYIGQSVAGAGDVNGDGLDDLIVGASNGGNAGRSYVVFGKAETTAVDLSAIAAGTGGFIINGQCANDDSGTSVAGAGDVNGDGLADLIVGADRSDPAGATSGGRSYIVFGKSGSNAVQLSAIAAGTGGFVINGPNSDALSGGSVAGAGDVNGDGLGDVIISADRNHNAATTPFRSTYVVLGKAGNAAIDLTAVAAGTGGFVIRDPGIYESIAGAGDVNGDGLADLIVGTYWADTASGSDAGRSYVVFGRSDNGPAIRLTAIAAGTGGFVINGACAHDYSGMSVAGAGDINGDGLADMIIGAPGEYNEYHVGRSYVVFGRSGTSPVELSAVAGGTGGFVINGESDDDSGWSVASAGDVNGDGLADLIVGAPDADSGAGTDSGRSYVIFGSTTGVFTTTVDQLGGSGPDTLTGTVTADVAETLVGGAGDDTFLADGGADVLYGGAGNDTFVLTAGNIAALSADLGAGNQLARIDGGGGLDTIQLQGAGITLNLQAIDNQGGATLGSTSRLESIERIDLSGSGDNTLTLGIRDVQDLASMNLVNSGTPLWESGDYTLPTSEGRHQLIVDGNAGDVANVIGGNWTRLGTVSHDGDTYTVYNSDAGLAQVLVANALAQNVQTDGDLSDVASGTGGFVIKGAYAGDYSGWSVASAGDVNGDGLTDLIVGAPSGSSSDGDHAGRTYVVFGRTSGTAIELSSLAIGSGFVIDGESADDYSGVSVAGAGDVNGDGLDDLIVGTRYGNAAQGYAAGRSYVVFGQCTEGAISLSAVALGSGGFAIDGASESERAGYSVAGAGDVNGDGLADLIVGAYRSDPAAGLNAGRSYVIFGRSGTGAVNLSAVAAGSGGFVVNGQCAGDRSGVDVAGAGDVNGDGLDDLIVGAFRGDPVAGTYAGRSYVVFGRSDSSAVDLSSVASGSGGFVINGQCAYDFSGKSVAGAGDVNGDGLADLIVGVSYGSPAAGFRAGRSYVVFGQGGGGAINLSAVAAGSGGFVINGECTYGYSGRSVAGAGDLNGDGLADVIVGAPLDSAGSAGRSYVVFGRSGGSPVELTAVAASTGGFMIGGQCAGDVSGSSVAAAGDVNGDGLADLIVGAHGADPGGGNAGQSYVIFGSTDGAFAATAVDQIDGNGDTTLTGTQAAETLVGGAGNDTLIGNGGADVLYGGTGNDSFVLNEGNVDALSAPLGGGGQVARVDGGGGSDSLVIDGADIQFDLSVISAPGVGSSRLESIERIDLTGSGNNTLTLSAEDLRDLTGGETLTVDGNTGDAVLFLTNSRLVLSNIDGDYQVFTQGNATLRVDFDVTVTLIGTPGDDTLESGPGNETIDGKDGIDTVSYANALNGVTVSLAVLGEQPTGGGGNDTLIAIENLIGSNQRDFLTGSDGNNVLEGGGGNDELTGGLGDDTASYASASQGVTASLEDEVATGGAGSDTLVGFENLTGSAHIDTLTGDDGHNNVLDGGAGVDTLSGGAGSDTYFVDDAFDVVVEDVPLTLTGLVDDREDPLSIGIGGVADLVNAAVSYSLSRTLDTKGVEELKLILGKQNALAATGNALANKLTGNEFANTLMGREGNDTLDGGLGLDTALYTGTIAGYTVTRVGANVRVASSAEGTDTLSLIEKLQFSDGARWMGGAQADVLQSTAAKEVFDGGDGSDTVSYAAFNARVTVSLATGNAQSTGGGGNDTLLSIENLIGGGQGDNLTGNSQANRLDGGGGADTLIGAAGNDTYVVNVTQDVVTETANAGTDLVQSTATYTLSANVENLTLLGNGSLNGTGNTLNNLLTGNNGNNSLNGAAGNDTLTGNGGNDTLDGGAGNDKLSGGAGNDTYKVNAAADSITEGSGAGTDLVQSATSYTLSNNVEHLTLTGSAKINATGNGGNNTLTGNGGNNILNGGAGNDTLVGGAGNDVLKGLLGLDVLTGGAGNDLFDFDNVNESGTDAATADRIMDFKSKQDRIDLSTIDANGGGGPNTAFKFITANAFSAPGQLRFDKVNHLLLGNTDSDSLPEFSILINGINSMAQGDFIL